MTTPIAVLDKSTPEPTPDITPQEFLKTMKDHANIHIEPRGTVRLLEENEPVKDAGLTLRRRRAWYMPNIELSQRLRGHFSFTTNHVEAIEANLSLTLQHFTRNTRVSITPLRSVTVLTCPSSMLPFQWEEDTWPSRDASIQHDTNVLQLQTTLRTSVIGQEVLLLIAQDTANNVLYIHSQAYVYTPLPWTEAWSRESSAPINSKIPHCPRCGHIHLERDGKHLPLWLRDSGAVTCKQCLHTSKKQVFGYE